MLLDEAGTLLRPRTPGTPRHGGVSRVSGISGPRRPLCRVVEDGTGGTSPSPAQRRAAAELIGRTRSETVRLIGSMTRLWDDVVEASEMSNSDDEHDPEGATVAFERAQLRDALGRARAELEDLDVAAGRLETGTYWYCERCGGPIAPARLTARPTARTCIACAAGTTR